MPRSSAGGPRKSRRFPAEAALFDRWVVDHAPELYRLAYRLCGECAAAEDLVQETFYEVWNQSSPLQSIREPRAWLLVILRRRYSRLRRQGQRRPWVVSLAAAQSAESEAGPRPDRAETVDSLQAALDDMSDLFKWPLLMVFMHGMTCARAAEQLDLPLGTVLSRIHRAKRQLRESIGLREEVPTVVSPTRATDDVPRLRIGGA